APYMVQQAGGLDSLTPDQRAAIVTTATLLGGLAAGALGQNALAGADAATNESLYNSTNPLDEANMKNLIPLEGGVGGAGGFAEGGGGTISMGEAAEALAQGVADAAVGAEAKMSSALSDAANWIETELSFATTRATNTGSLTTAEQMGILHDAATGGFLGKGNFSLGQATATEANELGAAWVGPGYRISSDGSSWVSSDGLRIYRPPSAKPNSSYATTGVQANFESKLTPGSRPISNGHLNITP
ncbi:hypothetical protein C9I56_35435, partial [Paraburkholderia caribensis]